MAWVLRAPVSMTQLTSKIRRRCDVTRINVWLGVVLLALGGTPWVLAKQAPQTTISPALGGTGTTDFIPIWTNTTTLGNSTIFQSGGIVSIRSILELPAPGTATALKGFNSLP